MPAKTKPAATAVLMDVESVAAELNASRRFVEKLIADGSLPAIRVGRRMVRVRRSDFDALLRPIPTVADCQSARGGA